MVFPITNNEVISDTSKETTDTSIETADLAQSTSRENYETSRETADLAKSTSRETAGTSKEITDTSRETILQALSTNENSTAKLIAEQLGITEKGVRYHLDKLKAEGIIKREGSTKKPIWRLLKRI